MVHDEVSFPNLRRSCYLEGIYAVHGDAKGYRLVGRALNEDEIDLVSDQQGLEHDYA